MFPVSLMIFAGSCIAAVSCQFQITSVNGRPASSGSFSSGSANDGGSQFSISSVNGRPVSTSGSLGSTLLVSLPIFPHHFAFLLIQEIADYRTPIL